jgi:hypothetical protein
MIIVYSFRTTCIQFYRMQARYIMIALLQVPFISQLKLICDSPTPGITEIYDF